MDRIARGTDRLSGSASLDRGGTTPCRSRLAQRRALADYIEDLEEGRDLSDYRGPTQSTTMRQLLSYNCRQGAVSMKAKTCLMVGIAMGISAFS